MSDLTGSTGQPQRQLFGTDGVRGVAGDDLTPELAVKLARAAVNQLTGERPQVLIACDTRQSRDMLAAAVAAGVADAGGDAWRAGVLPTAAVPMLVRSRGFALGVVISASHNPSRDNGIKFFGPDGLKLTDAAEAAIERALGALRPRPARIGGEYRFDRGLAEYLGALEGRFADLNLTGRRVLLDCANGSAFRAAPKIFRRLGATVKAVAAKPNGQNINERCGSTYPAFIQGAMRRGKGQHDIGFIFDGDCDRVWAIDRTGRLVDGDELMALIALHLHEQGRLPGPGVAVTVMTNYGFHAAMEEAGIEVAETRVGDRYVLEELLRRGWRFGGEQAGHIIDLDFGRSGDGIATALLLLEALEGRDLCDQRPMVKLPQVTKNVRGRDRRSLATAMADPAVAAAIGREQGALRERGGGSVLVRESGTEPAIRVTVQASSREEAEAVCDRLVTVVERALAHA